MQATALIIDFALASDKPFAVLPCCVFPKANPHRRTPCGGPVTTYDQFVNYLAAKHPLIRRHRLSQFEGRNVVLWYDPFPWAPLAGGGGGGRGDAGGGECAACEE